MNSPKVIEHAREILDIYGINIWTEIEERRKWPLQLGGLKNDEFVTFVRPDRKISADDPPNEIEL